MIFLSDGQCPVSDPTIQDVCRSAIKLGWVISFPNECIVDVAQRKPLSFHSISFGPDSSSSYLRRMANLALGIQNNAPRNPRTPPSIPSSYAVALDTVSNRPRQPY